MKICALFDIDCIIVLVLVPIQSAAVALIFSGDLCFFFSFYLRKNQIVLNFNLAFCFPILPLKYPTIISIRKLFSWFTFWSRNKSIEPALDLSYFSTSFDSISTIYSNIAEGIVFE